MSFARWIPISSMLGVTLVSVTLLPCSTSLMELEGAQQAVLMIAGKEAKVSAEIATTPKCADPESLRWGTSVGECPVNFVSRLSVLYGIEAAVIPVSAYSDLTSIRRLRIEAGNNGFKVVILGGDAATGYTSSLLFSTANSKQQPVLASRVVSHSENPLERNETFDYRFVSVDARY